jgi:hypothetical protein
VNAWDFNGWDYLATAAIPEIRVEAGDVLVWERPKLVWERPKMLVAKMSTKQCLWVSMSSAQWALLLAQHAESLTPILDAPCSVVDPRRAPFGSRRGCGRGHQEELARLRIQPGQIEASLQGSSLQGRASAPAGREGRCPVSAPREVPDISIELLVMAPIPEYGLRAGTVVALISRDRVLAAVGHGRDGNLVMRVLYHPQIQGPVEDVDAFLNEFAPRLRLYGVWTGIGGRSRHAIPLAVEHEIPLAVAAPQAVPAAPPRQFAFLSRLGGVPRGDNQ